MAASLPDLQRSQGASFAPGARTPDDFGDAANELRRCLERCAVADRGDYVRLLGTGPDLLGLVHRLSTKDLSRLSPGEGRATVLTTNKGRIVERLYVHHAGESGVLLLGGPGDAARILEHLARYTFAEQTGLVDLAASHFHFSLVGPAAGSALQSADLPVPQPLGVVRDASSGCWIVGQNGFAEDGWSVIGPMDRAAEAWRGLADGCAAAGGGPAGAVALEAWRILLGHPKSGAELTEDRNPLEAGLRRAVDFDKGCYVGQEVVARLNTYDKVVRRLMGLRLAAGAAVPAPGQELFRGERKAGTLTSAVAPPGLDWRAAIGFVHRDHAIAGETVHVGSPDGGPATLVELPFDV